MRTDITPDLDRCGARTRSGGRCLNFKMSNGRCRMHGGASPGAPFGEANGNYRHGKFTQEAMRERAAARERDAMFQVTLVIMDCYLKGLSPAATRQAIIERSKKSRYIARYVVEHMTLEPL